MTSTEGNEIMKYELTWQVEEVRTYKRIFTAAELDLTDAEIEQQGGLVEAILEQQADAYDTLAEFESDSTEFYVDLVTRDPREAFDV